MSSPLTHILKILQSDNGREFVNCVIHELIEDWPGEVTIISSRLRHPQSQGLIERGNAKVEEMLACQFYDEKPIAPLGQHGCLRFSVSCLHDCSVIINT